MCDHATVSSRWQGEVRDQARLVAHVARLALLAAIVGVLAGLAAAAFLEALRWATDARQDAAWLLWLLPPAGFAVGLVYWWAAGRAEQGSNLIIDEIHDPQAWVPRRMAPLVFAATIATHLFGGSAGREGTAIQMSGSLTDLVFRRFIHVSSGDRRMLLVAAIAGGFGAVFGVPIAGAVFGLEVQSLGRVRHDAIVPALTASIVGDRVVRALDVEHLPVPAIDAVSLDWALAGKVVLAAIAFGVTATVFIEVVHGVRSLVTRLLRWPPLRPLVGGAAIIILTSLLGTRDYLGLSLPLIGDALAGGAALATFAFAWKLVFTTVTLGSGFQGGEVTPLFVIGATLGATLGDALDAPVPLFAAIGFVAVFAGATNTPIACTIMGIELFGAGAVVPIAIGCIGAYIMSSHRGIYASQRIGAAKGPDPIHGRPTLRSWRERHP
jgi:H+/Cl- antiporter ClcA